MKKRIGRRQLIENLRMMRRQREDAIFWQKQAEKTADELRLQNREWRDRLEKLENNPDLEYVGSIPGGTLIQTATIDVSTAARLRDDRKSREFIRQEVARKLAEAIIEQGMMRVEYGAVPDPCSIRAEAFSTVRVVARLDVVPWDKLVRRTANGIVLEPRRFYEARMVPPVYKDMTRNEDLAQDAPAPWE